MGTSRKDVKTAELPRRFALRFVSGKYQGGEFPLSEGEQVEVGRSSDLDMVLVEEMVSRKHAVFRLSGSVLTVEDLGSTNGTFVNGERIEKATLREGDRVLIGTSILRVIATEGAPAGAAAKRQMLENATQKALKPRGNELPQTAEPPRMSGSLEEIPLPDLLQLFSTSKKSGVLVLRATSGTGRMYLEQGRIKHAEIDTSPHLPPRKAAYRLLTFTRGQFALDPPEHRAFPEQLDLSATEVLMEGIRLIDELNSISDAMPALDSPITLNRSMPNALRDLSPEDLDLIELALRGRTFGGALDHGTGSDADTARALIGLIERGLLVVG
jgi:pSer/pThr/pTyr-binding forkhead associated (FHA) protein